MTDEHTAEIVTAAERLVRCKGRYHSEMNMIALAALFGVTLPPTNEVAPEIAPTQALEEAAQKCLSWVEARQPAREGDALRNFAAAIRAAIGAGTKGPT
jgi:hypothetical protein